MPDSITLSAQTVGTSTLIMTALLGIGLFFFLRASGKDRTEQRIFRSELSLEKLGADLRRYLGERAYQLTDPDPQGVATFVGQARASWGFAVFLSSLAAVGLACLAVVIISLKPEWQALPWLLLLGSPLAGLYYFRRSQRTETLQVRLLESASGSELRIRGHRDELDNLEVALHLQLVED